MSARNLANGSREEINLDDIDPDNIDELLDEIELHEKKEEERRASQILAEKELKLQINSPVDEDEEEEDPLSDWIRSIWKVSSYCEVYSNPGQKWFKGTIKRIFADDEGEWLEVQYINQDNTIGCRQTLRDDIKAIRPLTKALSIYKYVHNTAITNQTNKIKTQFGQLQSPINIITNTDAKTNDNNDNANTEVKSNDNNDETKTNADTKDTNTNGSASNTQSDTNIDNDEINIINQLRLFGFDDTEIINGRSAANNKSDINEIVNLIYAQREAIEKAAIKQESEMIKQQEALRRLVSFGFDQQLASSALQAANNDLDAAVQHLTAADANQNLFYNDLAVNKSNKLIILNNLATNLTKYDQTMLTYNFAVGYDEKYSEFQELKSDQVTVDNGFSLYKFANFQEVHFIIPFCDANLINVYVQFHKDYDFMVFKRFNVTPNYSDNNNIKTDYLLSLLEIYRHPINSSKEFLNKINMSLDLNDILYMKKNNRLLHFAPIWTVKDGTNISNKLVINKLVEELNVSELSNEIKKLSSKYITLPFDENDTSCKLIIGYIKENRNDIPTSVMELIYSYFQYCIIRGNDLVIINANEKILTTVGVPEVGTLTYIVISKPLISGICKLTIRGTVSAQPELSIGIMTNPYVNVPLNKCVFDAKDCGESYQMYLSNGEIYRYDNAIYHMKNGKALNQQVVPVPKEVLNKAGTTIEMEIDFITYQITFFVNFEKYGQISIQKNVPYYAAFTFDCNNKLFNKSGPTKYEYEFNVTGERNIIIDNIKYDDEKKSDQLFIESGDDEKAMLNMSMKLQRLVSFGYDEELAYNALQRKHNDVEEAVQFLTDTNPADSPFYNDLVLYDNKVILLTGKNQISDSEVLGYRFVMSYNQKLNQNQKLKVEHVSKENNNCDIYQFNQISDVHFIVPFGTNPEQINIYIQFAPKYDFILFKQFYIYYDSIHESHFNKIDYLLSLLEVFKPKIKFVQTFWKNINIKLSKKDISLIRKSKKLFHFSPKWRKQDGKTVSKKFVVHRLVEELKFENEFAEEIKMISSTVVMSPFEENKDTDACKLTFGYIREMEMLLSLSQPIPFSLMKLIYLYFQYCIIKGNDLAIVDPKEKILSTFGGAGGTFTFARVSEQLIRGTYKFSIKFLVGAYSAACIGIITNPEVNIANTDFLFNNADCGDSYQMYVSAGQSFKTALYHYNAGAEIDKQQISHDSVSKKGAMIEVEVDFNTLTVAFYFNFERVGFPMQIQPETAYYATFAYDCNNGYFVTEGPPKYEYSFGMH